MGELAGDDQAQAVRLCPGRVTPDLPAASARTPAREPRHFAETDGVRKTTDTAGTSSAWQSGCEDLAKGQPTAGEPQPKTAGSPRRCPKLPRLSPPQGR